MNPFVEKLFERAITPAIEESVEKKPTGTVLLADPNNYVCTVICEEAYNGVCQVDNVPVKTMLLSSWFPQPGDEVEMRLIDGSLCILGPVKVTPETVRARTRMKSDIYASSPNSTVGGYIM